MRAPLHAVRIASALLVLALFTSEVVAQGGPGQSKYATVCSTCHQANGRGLPNAFPPLAGSEWLVGNPEVPIRIVLRGLQGPITVGGRNFNSVMPPWASLPDADIAAILTYARSSWGNRGAAVTVAQVAAARSATASHSRLFTAAELQPLRRP